MTAETTQSLPTARQVVKVSTRRGPLTIGPHGRIDGLWKIAERELRTVAQVLELCGWRERHSLRYWRSRGFPAPVLTLAARGGPLELWSRSEIEDWLEQRKTDAS